MTRVFLLAAKDMIALTLVLAVSVTRSAHADPPSYGVVNVAWDDCSTFGSAMRTFACDTNLGSAMLVGSFTSFVNLDSLNGNEIVLEMATTSVSTVSPWWQVKNYTDATPACRNGASSTNFDFTSGPSSCHDHWTGRALGGFGIIREPSVPRNQRILIVCAITPEEAGPVAAGVETYSYKLVINNTKTTGPGACGGCTDGALIVPWSILCTQNVGAASAVIGDAVNAYPADRNMATLGTYAQMNGGVPGAPGPTPTRNRSWGAVKSLYR